jgi:hypothetical protein
MFRVLRSHKVYVPLITVLGSMALFFIYYFFYVSWQRNYANDRAFRLLSVLSDQLEKRVENVQNVFAAALISSAAAKNEAEANHYLQERWGVKDEFSDVVARIKCHGTPNRDGELKLTLSGQTGRFSLSAEYRPKGSDESCSVSATVKPAADLRERFQNLTEGYFDDILIALPSGEVLFQERESGVRIASLNALMVPTKKEGGTSKPEDTASKKPPAGPVTAFQDASWFSNVVNIQLAGADYKLYIQPGSVVIRD